MSKEKIGDSETLAHAIDQAFSQKSAQKFTSISNSSSLAGLTRAELEVLRLIAAGLTNAAIAEDRGTALRTVEQQIQSIYEALGISETRDRNARVVAARLFFEASGAPRG